MALLDLGKWDVNDAEFNQLQGLGSRARRMTVSVST